MSEPVFGMIPAKKRNVNAKSKESLQQSSVVYGAQLQSFEDTRSPPLRGSSPVRHAQENPLGTISNIPLDTGGHPRSYHSRMELLVAQRELESGHEDILRLEAEIRKAKLG